jgi:glycerophosphoryl diester phosphodiesterase
MQWLFKTPIAHRGLHDNISIPENSLAAFESAVDKRYPIELDVQILSDGHLAVFHDTYLSRMTNQRGSILKKNSKQLKKIKLLDTSYTIPLFADVLKIVDGKVPLLIEIKNRKRVGKLEGKLLEMLNRYKGEYAIESFNPLSVKWFRENAPDITRGQLSGAIGTGRGIKNRVLIRGAFFRIFTRPDFIAYDIRYLPSRKVTRLREIGFPVIGYTAKSKASFNDALKYCDNVIFEGFLP